MSKGTSKATKVIDGLYYTKEHEWARVEGDLVVVGITDYAQHALHEITFVEIMQSGTTLNAGEECGLVESMKASSDVFSPVSGQIVEVNTSLEDSPETVNEDPYGKGWMYKIRPSNLKADLKKLMDSKAYASFVASKT
ncbi:MAG: glycine cleavage system protein H [Candidatus Thorarchaeota archaeon]|nr:MAG: glycine cleavage system protein H [Candidatus Thorarchaeota archaeon]